MRAHQPCFGLFGRNPLEGGASRTLETVRDPVRHTFARLFERLSDAFCELLVVHGEIPRARRAWANACVAREQCVFTLPSEHPIAAAVSATSISSQ